MKTAAPALATLLSPLTAGFLPIAAFLLISCFLLAAGCNSGPQVTFTEWSDRIDVTFDGKPFTSYRFEGLTKPILFPLRSPSGVIVTRGFPIEPARGESHDHPHHTGLFFTYDQVNGEGFWNNTTSPPRIRHTGVTSVEGGCGEGTLSTASVWEGKDGAPLLHEARTMVFRPGETETTIDFTIRLTAAEKEVVFEDTKEGMFGIRVAPWLRERGGTGRYLNEHGDETEKNVWGKRARWVRLEGKKNDKTIGIAIANHPDSVNFPTYWHARGYGLFAANPLGQGVFENSRKTGNDTPFRLTLAPGKSALFRFRVVLYDGERSQSDLDALLQDAME